MVLVPEGDLEELRVGGQFVLDEPERGLRDRGEFFEEHPGQNHYDCQASQGRSAVAMILPEMVEKRKVVRPELGIERGRGPIPLILNFRHRTRPGKADLVPAQAVNNLFQRREHQHVPLHDENRVPLQTRAAPEMPLEQ